MSSVAGFPLATAATARAPRGKVVIIGPTPPPVHGMTTFTQMLLDSPVLSGSYEVLHVNTSDRRDLGNMGRLDLTNVRLALQHAVALARVIRRERPDVVFVQVSQNGWAYLRDAVLIGVSKVLGCRVLTHLNGGYFGEFYRTTNPVCRALIRLSSRWVDAAAVLAPGLRPLYGGLVPDARIRVLANGVADEFPGEPERRPRSGSPLNVTYLGTLYAPKGYLDLIDAARRLPGPGYRFRFAGGWFSADEEREARRRAAGDPRIEFAGVVTGESKRALLRDTDVLVLPTYYPYEGQPQVILEAMAAGVPVIATARAAIPEMVVPGETGMLVPERDPAAIAAALERLAANPAERCRLGIGARRLYLARFTAEHCAESLVELLDWVRTRTEAGR